MSKIYTTLNKNGKIFRKYDEKTTSISETFLIETELKWRELLQKNHNIYYFKCSSKNDSKPSFNFFRNFISFDKLNKNNKKIIKNQIKDINFLFKNKLFDILYIIPQVNLDNNYYFNFIIFLENNKNLNKILEKINKKNYNLINILETIRIDEKDLSFDFIDNLLKLNPNLLNDNFFFWDNTFKVFSNEYMKNLFALICLQIYSFDKITIDGVEVSVYNLDFDFATNFCVVTNNIKNGEDYTFFALSDNFDVLNISISSLKKK